MATASELSLARRAKRAGIDRSVFLQHRTRGIERHARTHAWSRKRTARTLARMTRAADRIWPSTTKKKPARLGKRAQQAARDAVTFGTAFTQFKEQRVPIRVLCETFGVPSQATLRKAFIRLAGGPLSFRKLRAAGAGKGPERTKKTTLPKTLAPDQDANVKRLKHMRASRGWTVKRMYEPCVVRVRDKDGVQELLWQELLYTVHVSPKGREYVLCLPTEPADLLHVGVTKKLGVPPVRLRRVERSVLVERMASRVGSFARAQDAREEKRATRKGGV